VIKARTAAEVQGFAYDTFDTAALLARGPVMFGGVKPDDALRLWLSAISMTIGGRGIVANDPGTGQQVILGYGGRR